MNFRGERVVALAFVALMLASCVTAPQTATLDTLLPEQSKSRVLVNDVPFFPQEQYQCGLAALATLLKFNGDEVTPSSLIDEVFVPGRNGSFQLEMLAAARSHGQLAYQIDPSLVDLMLEVQAGNPVLVLQNLGLSIRPQWHFAVVKGYDYARQRVILNSGTIEDYELSLKTFERTWARAEHWAVVIAAPESVPATASEQRYFQSLVDLQHSFKGFVQTERAYEAGLQRWPQNKQLLLGLGNHYLAAERYRKAAEIYDEAVGYYPDYPPALNNLAHTLLQLGDAQAALSYAQKAIEHADEYTDVYRKTYQEIEASIESAEVSRR